MRRRSEAQSGQRACPHVCRDISFGNGEFALRTVAEVPSVEETAEPFRGSPPVPPQNWGTLNAR